MTRVPIGEYRCDCVLAKRWWQVCIGKGECFDLPPSSILTCSFLVFMRLQFFFRCLQFSWCVIPIDRYRSSLGMIELLQARFGFLDPVTVASPLFSPSSALKWAAAGVGGSARWKWRPAHSRVSAFSAEEHQNRDSFIAGFRDRSTVIVVIFI